ncbi:CocE/NonD family hydrolase [Amycolatopsis lurida]
MRVLGGLLVLVLLAGLTAPVSAAGAAFQLENGVSAPIHSYEHAIRETVWVDIGTDLDRDGAGDRIAADIIRPAEPAARGQRVPVIMDVSPYYACCGRGNEAQKKTYAPDGTPLGFPLFYDNYFVPRGYAVVLVDAGGTNRSRGCFDDVPSGRGVVDWLNGRAIGYSAVEGGTPVRADWTTGAVGLVGKSQDGATAIGVASTGVEGLRTIVPIAGVSSYYEVHNSDGAWHGGGGGPPGLLNPRAQELCEPWMAEQAELAGTDGDYNRYWESLNYVHQAHRVRASVFAAQGFGDLNVRTIQFGPWWDALGAHGVTRKAWLSQAGHVDPFDLQRPEFVHTLHRWLDRWLLDVRNGIEHEPAVHREAAVDQWVDERRWPPASARPVTLRPSADGDLGTAPANGMKSIVDDPALTGYDWIRQPADPSTARVVFTTEPLDQPTQLSGTGSVTVKVRSSTPQARAGAMLVDYGPATVRATYQGAPGIRNLETRSCWGESAPGDSACYLDTETTTELLDHQLLAAGWADIGHHRTLWRGEDLRPDRYYTMTFRISTVDKLVPAGHRIGLVLGGTDASRIHSPSQRPALDFDLAGTSVSVPVAGPKP